MKQKISIFLFALLSIGFSRNAYGQVPVCPGPWKGVYRVHGNEYYFYLAWHPGGASWYELQVADVPKVPLRPTWITKKKTSGYSGSIRGLTPNHMYQIRIIRVCPLTGERIPTFVGNFKTAKHTLIDPQNSCSAMNNVTVETTRNTIRITNTFDVKTKVNRWNEHFVQYWEKGHFSTYQWHALLKWEKYRVYWPAKPVIDRTIKGLKPDTEYAFRVVTYCGENFHGKDWFLGNITGIIYVKTEAPPPCHDRVKNIRLGEVTATTATITWDKIYQWPFPEGAGYLLRYRIVGASSWESSVYVAPLPSKKLEGLKPATKYEFQIAARCSPYSISEEWMPISAGRFTTLPDKDQCGGKLGDFTAPSINNTNGNYFYNGTIESSKPIALQSATVTFKSGNVVELNPGFEVNVSQSGMFEASAYNRANCQASTATANSGRGIAQSANATESVSIAYPISATSLKALPRYGVYPNPNNGSFSIDFKGTDEVIKSITVYDMFGIRIFNKVYNRKLNVERYSLPLAKSGLYKIAIRSASGVAYETLLVEF